MCVEVVLTKSVFQCQLPRTRSSSVLEGFRIAEAVAPHPALNMEHFLFYGCQHAFVLRLDSNKCPTDSLKFRGEHLLLV